MDNKLAHRRRYEQFAKSGDARSSAFAMVGGGDIERVGFVEMRILAQFTHLDDAKVVIDVGCGPGRLARYLTDRLDLKLIGTDVVSELLDVARTECHRPDWDFVEVSDISIPVEDGRADIVAIFSVLTNIFPELGYLMVQDAARALRSGGRLVISYLDIGQRAHHANFRVLAQKYAERIDPLVFLSRDFLEFFAMESGLKVVTFVPPEAIQAYAPPGSLLLDGREIEGPLSLGQTICILEKP